MEKLSVDKLNIQIYADGADLGDMKKWANDPLIRGFTTNPTLMAKAGVSDFRSFAVKVLDAIGDKPVSFEVVADDQRTMEAQARAIASWGDNVYVKVPVTTTSGEFCGPIIARLSKSGIKLNITAIMTLDQVKRVGEALDPDVPAIVSVFAGRVADTGRDPIPHMVESLRTLADKPRAELLWASPREVLNIYQADAIGCHIITVTSDLLKKLALCGKDLEEYSRETVAMFYKDANSAGVTIPLADAMAIS